MNGAFQIWAPQGARWSPWVKPVLFAWMQGRIATSPLPELSPDWEFSGLAARGQCPAGELGEERLRNAGSTLLVLDLPGAEGIAAGLALTAHGFRPVPLYNAIPSATPADSDGGQADDAPPLVDVRSIADALVAATPRLALKQLPDDAPPAFLLDALRRTGGRPPQPGYFDNRSVSFPTDFPSANFLLARGFGRAVLVQRASAQPAADLAHTLRAWQEAGITIELKRVEIPGLPVVCDVPKPRLFGQWFYRALEMMGLRRNTLGGFGGVLPDPSSGG